MEVDMGRPPAGGGRTCGRPQCSQGAQLGGDRVCEMVMGPTPWIIPFSVGISKASNRGCDCPQHTCECVGGGGGMAFTTPTTLCRDAKEEREPMTARALSRAAKRGGHIWLTL